MAADLVEVADASARCRLRGVLAVDELDVKRVTMAAHSDHVGELVAPVIVDDELPRFCCSVG